MFGLASIVEGKCMVSTLLPFSFTSSGVREEQVKSSSEVPVVYTSFPMPCPRDKEPISTICLFTLCSYMYTREMMKVSLTTHHSLDLSRVYFDIRVAKVSM